MGELSGRTEFNSKLQYRIKDAATLAINMKEGIITMKFGNAEVAGRKPASSSIR
jgi:hypothetical protein